jgi:1,6-anhydro-N-acetylmuramate kinase
MLAMGLMSGTSQDGVDVALIETDGDIITRFGGTAYRSYSTSERALIRSATAVALNVTERTARPEIVAAAEAAVNEAHVEAVATFLAANSVRPRDVAVIGFHGQTVLHRPERRLTIQIGDGRVLAARLGIPVVYDFRAADVAAGGEGAPFSPMYHRALARRRGGEPPVAVLNIGGVANVTYIDGDDLIAWTPDRAMHCSTISCGCGSPSRSTLTGIWRRRAGWTGRRSRDCSGIRSLPSRRLNRSTGTRFGAGWALHSTAAAWKTGPLP